MTYLKDLPRKAPLRVKLQSGEMADAVFHRLDGSYSYCTVVGDDPAPGELQRAFHLHVLTPLREVDGRWEVQDDWAGG